MSEMTPEQARSVLRAHHICPKHGVRMHQGSDAAALAMIGEEADWICYRCESERTIANATAIVEAKRVLGLEGGNRGTE